MYRTDCCVSASRLLGASNVQLTGRLTTCGARPHCYLLVMCSGVRVQQVERLSLVAVLSAHSVRKHQMVAASWLLRMGRSCSGCLAPSSRTMVPAVARPSDKDAARRRARHMEQ